MKLRLLPAALLLASHPLFAAEAALEAVIVTASRTARTADETLAPVTVITRGDIERLQAQSVLELLTGQPGIAVSNTGGLGKTSGVFLRGGESSHVLVLIDGVKVGSATNGATPFEQLPIDQIERIEIVRGPRSSLYGSEAIGGVIQIFTRKGSGPLTPSFSLGAGSHRTGQFSGGLSGGGADTWYNLSLSGVDSDGFNACKGSASAGCFTFEPDKDGYRNLAGSARGGMRLANGTEVDVRWLRSNSATQFDGGFVNYSKTVQQVLGVSLRLNPLAAWQMTLNGGRSLDDSDSYKNSAWMSRFNTRRDTLSWQNDLSVSANQLVTLGLDYQNDDVDSNNAYTVTRRDNRGAFAQYQGNFGAHNLQFSLRGDDNQQFGNRTTGGAAWGIKLTDKLRLAASYGTAFKAPTFNDLYYPGYGSPDLKPESSRSAELGLRGKHSGIDWALNAFRTEVEDLIAFDASRYAPGNVASARILGLEGTLGMRIREWRANAAVTLLDPENRSAGAHFGKQLARRPEQSLRLDLDRNLGPYRFGATLLAAGARYDDLANTRRLGGYATLDLRADYRVAKEWLLQAKAGNLFDRDYETAAFYNQPGRNVFITLRYQPTR